MEELSNHKDIGQAAGWNVAARFEAGLCWDPDSAQDHDGVLTHVTVRIDSAVNALQL